VTRYLAGLRNYSEFGGRADRKEFWIFQLSNAIVVSALVTVIRILSSTRSCSSPP
jgi:uncharacterized membrane protein YhaH (DUF805 family)